MADAYQHRFWGQLVRWAAAEQLLPAGNACVRYGSLEAVYRPDQEIAVQLRLLDEETQLPPGAFAGLRLYRQTGGGKETAVTLVELRRRDKQPQMLEATLRPLPPGTYRLEPVIPDLKDKLAVQGDAADGPTRRRDTFTVLATDAGELADLSTDWEGLQHLASVSGGAVFTPETAADLIDRLAQRGDPTTALRASTVAGSTVGVGNVRIVRGSVDAGVGQPQVGRVAVRK